MTREKGATTSSVAVDATNYRLAALRIVRAFDQFGNLNDRLEGSNVLPVGSVLPPTIEDCFEPTTLHWPLVVRLYSSKKNRRSSPRRLPLLRLTAV